MEAVLEIDCTIVFIVSSASTKDVLKQVKRLELHLNRLKLLPATHRRRSIVLLPLLSKALTVGRAVCALIDAGLPAEAFATSRTLLEIFFSVRYITNKNTERRAAEYLKYQARVRLEWMNIAQKHFPKKAATLRALDPFTLEIANEFKNKGSWTGLAGQTRQMALEEDSVEVDKHGQPLKSDFDYDVLYFWTSQYVHATVAGIDGHTIRRGEVFKVRAQRREEKHCGEDALYVTVCTLCKVFIHACRSMNEVQPKAIEGLYKMIRKIY